MNKLILIILVLIFSKAEGQTKVKSNSSSKDTSGIHIELNGEKINISQKRLDSLANVVLNSFSAMINDKENQKYIKESVETMQSKFEKALDILIENPSQSEKVKKEFKSTMKDIKPAIDSALKNVRIELDNAKKELKSK